MSNIVFDLGAKEEDTNKNFELYRDVSMISDMKRVEQGENKMWISKDVNVKAVFNSLRNIFTWIQGERILLPEFGSKLRLYLYEQITEANIERIISEIQSVCLRWEPRVNIVKVANVGTVEDTEDNTVRLDIIFTIPSLSDEQYNYSYIYTRTE